MYKTAAEDIANIKSRLDEAFSNETYRTEERSLKKISEEFNRMDISILLEAIGATADAAGADGEKLLQKIKRIMRQTASRIVDDVRDVARYFYNNGKMVAQMLGKMLQSIIAWVASIVAGVVTGAVFAAGVIVSSKILTGAIEIFTTEMTTHALFKAISALLATALGEMAGGIIGAFVFVYLVYKFVVLVFKLYKTMITAIAHSTMATFEYAEKAVDIIIGWISEDDTNIVKKSRERVQKHQSSNA